MTVVICDTYSDLHKDVYGFRPRNVHFETQEEFDAEYERLCRQLEVVIKEERQAELKNQKELKRRIRSLMASHSIDALTALRWDFEAFGCDSGYGWDEYCYTLNIGYRFGYILKGRGILPNPSTSHRDWQERERSREDYLAEFGYDDGP